MSKTYTIGLFETMMCQVALQRIHLQYGPGLNPDWVQVMVNEHMARVADFIVNETPLRDPRHDDVAFYGIPKYKLEGR